MHDHRSHYPTTHSEDQVLKMWLKPTRAANVRSDTSWSFPPINEAHTTYYQGSWGSSTLINEEVCPSKLATGSLLKREQSSSPVSEDGDDGKFAAPLRCAWVRLMPRNHRLPLIYFSARRCRLRPRLQRQTATPLSHVYR